MLRLLTTTALVHLLGLLTLAWAAGDVAFYQLGRR